MHIAERIIINNSALGLADPILSKLHSDFIAIQCDELKKREPNISDKVLTEVSDSMAKDLLAGIKVYEEKFQPHKKDNRRRVFNKYLPIKIEPSM